MWLQFKKDKIVVFMLIGVTIGSFFFLPVNAASSNAQYMELINNSLDMNEAERNLLEKNQFVVLNKLATDDILDAFIYYWEEDLPIMITSDMMLHIWHLLFDERLEDLEEQFFFESLSKMILNMHDLMSESFSKTEFPVTASLAIQDVRIYLTTALKIIGEDYSSQLPEVESAAEKIYDLIMGNTPYAQVISSLSSDYECRFIDDYSQYMPRGHYTHSETLKKYFRLFKWLARIPFYFDEYNTKSLLKREEEDMFHSALILSWLVENSEITYSKYYQQSSTLDSLGIYTTFNQFLDKVVGKSYSVTIPDLLGETQNWMTLDQNNITDVSTGSLETIRQAILSNQSITHPLGTGLIAKAMESFNMDPKTFHFIGERLQMDTYLLNQMVNPYIQGKAFPSGLEFAAIVMDSDHALNRLDSPYQDKLLDLREAKENWTESSNASITMRWYDSLQEIASPEPKMANTSNIVIPQFMASPIWQDKQMTTILGSWAQLKHDMILYIQQGSGGIMCSTPAGYVEPYPEFYQKLARMVSEYSAWINFVENSIPIQYSETDEGASQLIDALIMLSSIAQNELEQRSLSAEQQEFLQSVFFRTFDFYSGYTAHGWLTDLLANIDYGYNALSKEPNSHVSLIADIHTDTATQKVLEIATGLFEHIVAIVPGWDGGTMAVVGPVFSYYEFQVGIDSRMTDEMWRGIVYDKLRGFDFRGPWAKNYMASTSMPDSILFDSEFGDLGFEAPSWYKTSASLVVSNNYPTLTIGLTYNSPFPIDNLDFQFHTGNIFYSHLNQIIVFVLTVGFGLAYFELRHRKKVLNPASNKVNYVINFAEEDYFLRRTLTPEQIALRKPSNATIILSFLIPVLGWCFAFLFAILQRPQSGKNCLKWGFWGLGVWLATLIIVLGLSFTLGFIGITASPFILIGLHVVGIKTAKKKDIIWD
ncbi:hypothetical protein NEF87_001072 [Candidatus Lokiarchaeum ossiferum]|uniref:DUF3160 domain-containing protein n=1 Tax=Candidatus Lokiarchaeum ossiferum TaxID=2951803 RepID=A0ABY6HPG7_9ARCH|nr:hypothetical protein NEF87_001072 [Candidatus Lokiarchaeum sp. B-35]